MSTGSRLPVTAIVASRDEAGDLARLLPTIRFCDEILVVDLQSSDETAAVAAAHGAEVIRLAPLASVERVRAELAPRARHDWLLFTDPDEELPPPLAAEVAAVVGEPEPDVSVVYAPIRYHFAGRPLRGTVWGGVRERRLLVLRSGAVIGATIYSGAMPRTGFRTSAIPYTGENAIVHRWLPGYGAFVRKHRRYVRVAAEDRCASGELTGPRAVFLMPFRSFWESFVARRGYLDGPTGLVLSLLWAWYATGVEWALLRRTRASVRA